MTVDQTEIGQARLDAIIVNWNAGHQLLECIESFANVADDKVQLDNVIVVDNSSTDCSLQTLEDWCETLPLQIIRNGENRGFAAACNQGAAGSSADFLLFLNPDTRLCAGCLEEPAALFATPGGQRVGIAGIQLINAAGEVARSCARRPTGSAMIGQSLGLDRLFPSCFPPHFLSEWPHDGTREVDQVMGAFFMIRRPLFEQLGGFDERFFVYFEDLDLALRARARGWTSVYVATAQAVHAGQGTTKAVKAHRLFYWSRSRIFFAFKHFTRTIAGTVAVTTLVIEPFTRTLAAVIGGRIAELPNIFRGYVLLWSDLLHTLRARGGGASRCLTFWG
jgi:N-acetylglucosaminyl-diphospho-decaprenol L-rhamnosyltransferase